MAPREPVDAAHPLGERVLGRVPVFGDALRQGAAQMHQRGATGARRHLLRVRGTAREQADTAGAAHREAADHERDTFRDIRLQALRGAKRHARRDVHEHPRRERALGDVVAHVRMAGARGGGGVELADVVADLVGPDLREFGPHAQARRAPLTRKGAGRAVGEDEVERLDQRRLHRPRAL